MSFLTLDESIVIIFAPQGRTPLRVALLEGSLDIAGLLLDNGADIDYVDTDSRSSLYIMALENDVKTVEFLLNHGANTELKDCDGRTALHVAAWQGYTDIVQVRVRGNTTCILITLYGISLKKICVCKMFCLKNFSNIFK